MWLLPVSILVTAAVLSVPLSRYLAWIMEGQYQAPRLLRWFVHPKLGGKLFLKLVFWLEDRFPKFFGENGQYPLIVIKKKA